MDREQWDSWCERGILGLVLSILVLGPLAYGAVRPIEFAVVQSLTIGVVLLWVLRLWLKPLPVFFFPPICWAVIAFVLYAIIRYQLAPIEYVARLELIKVLVYAFLFFAIANNLNRKESAQTIVVTLIAVAFALSAFGIFQVITRYEKIWGMIKPEGYVIRASGTFINPNNFAGFLEMILPLALACTVMSKFKHASKVIFAYASLVILVGLGATLSRGGWIAGALMLIVFCTILIMRRDFRLRSVIIFALLLSVGFGLIASAEQSQKRFKEVFDKGEIQNSRGHYWKIAEQLWREDIWLGAGPAHYDYRFRQYRPSSLQGRPQFTHNDYLNTLADWGLVGLGIIAAFITLFYVGVFKTWRYVQRSSSDLGRKKSNKAAFVMGGSLGVLALLFHSVVDFNMHIPSNAILAITLIALVTSYLRFATDSFWSSLGWPFKSIITLVAFAGMFYLGEQAIRQTREQLVLAQAAGEKDGSDGKLNLLQMAFKIEPKNFETAYAIGEIYRVRSLNGNRGYEELTQQAMDWFKRSMDLNPFFPDSHLRYGMCLDWIGKTGEAKVFFDRAAQLDPNGYYTVAHQGWYLMQLGDLEGALEKFMRSEQLMHNSIAESYLEIIEQKMSEAAAEK